MVVCHCRRINDRTIAEVAKRLGPSLDEVSRECGAGTDCGGCRDEIERLLGAARGAASERSGSDEVPVGSVP